MPKTISKYLIIIFSLLHTVVIRTHSFIHSTNMKLTHTRH